MHWQITNYPSPSDFKFDFGKREGVGVKAANVAVLCFGSLTQSAIQARMAKEANALPVLPHVSPSFICARSRIGIVWKLEKWGWRT
jgi:hypothetical protein